ncbi:DUF2062 domain-containing protein [Methylonatrum kenyense]|uniref:DUF2062 domain-containing protein n=1 Tax=Methylonatrum kenyense TaxID=455253 RepID=UPI0020BD9146|nr:DUF2062 domain-containing protein [Methylonatrum kenyense]MCK8516479.1 DUF2062 domain-containing protein [Methylonatrum kenyense]
MPKHLIRRYLPSSRKLREHQSVRMFGNRLQDSRLWHLNRHPVAGGFGIGVFLAFQPMPFQMLAAAFLAILLRLNLPVSVLAVWISNPLTMAPLLFFNYRIGSWMLGRGDRERGFEPTLHWFWTEFHAIWQPLLLGSIICGAIAAMAAYGFVHLVWRLHLRQRLRLRRLRQRRNAEKEQRTGK